MHIVNLFVERIVKSFQIYLKTYKLYSKPGIANKKYDSKVVTEIRGIIHYVSKNLNLYSC